MTNQMSGRDLPNVDLGNKIFCTISTVLSELVVKIQLPGKRKPSWSNSCRKLMRCWLPLLVKHITNILSESLFSFTDTTPGDFAENEK